MANEFVVDFTGSDKRLRGRLRRIRLRLKHGRDFGRDALAVVDRWIQGNFTTEGGNVGGWKPLDPKTVNRRRRKSNVPLQDTGWLKRSWVYAVGRLEATLKEGGKKGKVTFGKTISQAFYGSFHDKGKGVPQRRILPEAHEVEKDVKAAYSFHIDKETRK